VPLKYKLRKLKELLRFDNAAQVLMNRMFFSRTSQCIYRYRGVTALVDHSKGDQDGVKACLVPGLYDPFLSIIARTSPHPLTLLDLGANTGGFPLAMLAHGLTIKKGVAVELNPLTCTRLRLNLAINGLSSQMEVVHGAVCGESGKLQVNISQGSVSDSIVFQTAVGNSLTVDGWSIRDVMHSGFGEFQSIDICKIDIEGAEYGVFDDPSHASLGRCRWIVIEIHDFPGRTPGEIRHKIEAIGFKALEPSAKSVEDNVFLFERISCKMEPSSP
jgi:FkbM family methyltransferase